MKTALKIKISLYFLCLIMLSTCSLMAQEAACDCSKDLEFLVNVLKQSPAYKIDYGKNTSGFDKAAEVLLAKAESTTSIFDCYVLLAKAVSLLNDGHNSLYGIQQEVAEELTEAEKITAYQETDFYAMYPHFDAVSELQQRLKTVPESTVEGVYSAGSKLKVGVVKRKGEERYEMRILESQLPLWSPGEQLGILLPQSQGKFIAVMGNYQTKTPMMIRTGLNNGTFFSLSLKKHVDQKDFWLPKNTEENYQFEGLDSEVSYIKVGSFSGFNPTLSKAEAFYETLKNKQLGDHLIVDLRNNYGGGDRNSKLLYKILRRYAKRHHLYILINQNTASNAEQFALKMRALDNVMVLGDYSKGILTYELEGKSHKLPSGYFKLSISSKAHKKYLPYEGIGVTPDVFLEYSVDWIEQTRAYMEN